MGRFCHIMCIYLLKFVAECHFLHVKAVYQVILPYLFILLMYVIAVVDIMMQAVNEVKRPQRCK